MSESLLKAAVIEMLTYLQNRGDLLFHRLNSGAAFNEQTLKDGRTRRYKIAGQKKGTADILVLLRRYHKGVNELDVVNIFIPLYIELKSPEARVITDPKHPQNEFKEYVQLRGALYYRITTLYDLANTLQENGVTNVPEVMK